MPTQVANYPGHEHQRKPFYHLGRFWYFSDDGSGNIYFRSSTDNVTWSASTVVASGTGYRQPAVYVDYANNKVHLTWNDGGGKHVFYKLGTLNSDGTITWGATETVCTITESSVDHQNIWVDASGNIWVVAYGYAATTSEPWYLFKKPPSGSWTQVVKTTDNRPVDLTVFVLDNGKIVVIRTCEGFSNADNYLKVWVSADGGSTWSSYTLSGYSVHHHCAVFIGNIVHISFTTTSYYVYYVKFDGSANTFGTPVNLWTDSTMVRTTISKDTQGNLYVFWCRDGTAGATLRYRKSTDGGSTWASSVELASATETTDHDERLSTEYVAYNSRISIYYNMSGYTWFHYITTPVAWQQTLSESLGLLDKAVKGSSIVKMDGLGLSDAYAGSWAIYRTYYDGIGLLDTYSRSWSIYRVYGELLGLGDYTLKAPSIMKAELAGLSDAITRSPSSMRSEMLGLADSMRKDVSTILLDLIGLLDILGIARLIVLLDMLGLTDTVSRSPSVIKPDSLGLMDVFYRTWGISRTYGEAVGLVDTTSAVKAFFRYLDEMLGLSDMIIKATQSIRTDNLGLLDAYSRTWTAHATYYETLGLLDTITRGAYSFLIEALGLLDSTYRGPSHVILEKAGLTDYIRKAPLSSRYDVLDLTDRVSKLASTLRAEKIGMIDTILALKAFFRYLDEKIGLSDMLRKSTSMTLRDYITLIDRLLPYVPPRILTVIKTQPHYIVEIGKVSELISKLMVPLPPDTRIVSQEFPRYLAEKDKTSELRTKIKKQQS
jgi:hypothetical protein